MQDGKTSSVSLHWVVRDADMAAWFLSELEDLAQGGSTCCVSITVHLTTAQVCNYQKPGLQPHQQVCCMAASALCQLDSRAAASTTGVAPTCAQRLVSEVDLPNINCTSLTGWTCK